MTQFLIPLCYLTLYIVWGSTYFFIKVAVETLPPITLLGLRFTIGGALLLGLAALTGRIRTRPTWRQLGASALLGALLLLGGNGLITVAEKKVDSYLVALILASTPMVVAFYDRVLLNKRISAVRLAGIAAGIVGVAFLLYTGDGFSGALSPHMLLVIAGIACWGLATSLGHAIKAYPDPLTNSAIQMILAGVFSLGGSLFFAPPPAVLLGQVTPQSGWAAAYLAVVGSLAFGAYTYLIAHEPAIRVSSYSLVNPLIATMLGLLVGNETAVPLLGIGLPLVLLGTTLMLYGEAALARFKRRRSEAAASLSGPD